MTSDAVRLLDSWMPRGHSNEEGPPSLLALCPSVSSAVDHLMEQLCPITQSPSLNSKVRRRDRWLPLNPGEFCITPYTGVKGLPESSTLLPDKLEKTIVCVVETRSDFKLGPLVVPCPASRSEDTFLLLALES